MSHLHQRSRHPWVKNISPTPSEKSPVADNANIFSAVGFTTGARHGADGIVSARGLLVSGAGSAFPTEGERRRFEPTMGSETSTSCSIWEDDSCIRPITFHGPSDSPSRLIIITPGVPAYRFRMGNLDTHEPHTKQSYSEPVIRGGGRPEEEVSDGALSLSFASSSGLCKFVGGEFRTGDASRDEGLSRKFKHDS